MSQFRQEGKWRNKPPSPKLRSTGLSIPQGASSLLVMAFGGSDTFLHINCHWAHEQSELVQ